MFARADTGDGTTVTPRPSSACPFGWFLFNDDGNEMRDSCIKVFTTPLNFTAANNACKAQGVNGHLLTFRYTGRSGSILSAATTLSSATFWVGGYQLPTAIHRGAGWLWVDGTDAANLNCGSFTGATACNSWATNPEPKYVLQCRVVCFAWVFV